MKIFNVGAHGAGNAGDTVILDCVPKLFPDAEFVKWKDFQEFGESALEQANSCDLVLVAGGGLFIRDTHANQNSGWRWNISLDMLDRIEKPIAVFGVGHNRFRNQEDFLPVFYEHIGKLLEKSVFFGLRGMTENLLFANRLPADTVAEIRYQPCPASFCGKFYPQFERKKSRKVVFVPAFDRPQMRYGDNENFIFWHIGKSLKELEKRGCEINLALHVGSDRRILEYFDHKVFDLRSKTTEEILDFYSDAFLVLGMRLHGLVIPFGLGVPFVGIASHDKIQRFCQDLGYPEWCADVEDLDLSGSILEKCDFGHEERFRELKKAQEEQWLFSKLNVSRIMEAV